MAWAVDDPSAHFSVDLWTGGWINGENSDTHTVVSGFQPDAVWIKKRSSTGNHQMFDSSRGITTKILYPHLSNAEATVSNRVQSLNSDGYVIGPEDANNDGETYVGWSWKANGGTRTTNTESGNDPGGGYQANTTAGFSIVDYVGTGAAGTMAHGLGVKPELVLIKNRSRNDNWRMGSDFLTGWNYNIAIDVANAEWQNTGVFNSTAPTSSVFSIGDDGATNANGENHVAYVFKNVQGFSKSGKYIGNGNVDGPFVYTGFKPAWLMFKERGNADSWLMLDHKRDPVNDDTPIYFSVEDNSADNTDSDAPVDFLSNGFKLRNSSSIRNADGEAYIYLAFAEQPFVTSGGVPCTGR